jgi:hypothetical protein
MTDSVPNGAVSFTSPNRRVNKFNPLPLYVSVGLWIVTVLPIVYEPGNLFFPGTLLPGLFLLPIFALVFLFRLVLTIIRRQWKRALSLTMGALVFCILSLTTLYLSDEIHFWTLSPYYFAEVAKIKQTDDKPKITRFVWGGGIGWDTWLDYDESDSIAPPVGHAVRSWNDEGTVVGCVHRVRRMYRHFYLHQFVC